MHTACTVGSTSDRKCSLPLARCWRRHSPANTTLLLLRWTQHLERAHERLVDAHHRSRVVELSAVVRSTENCYKLSAREELIPIFHNLMRPHNQIEVLLSITRCHKREYPGSFPSLLHTFLSASHFLKQLYAPGKLCLSLERHNTHTHTNTNTIVQN
jgi:hypothetical protein